MPRRVQQKRFYAESDDDEDDPESEEEVRRPAKKRSKVNSKSKNKRKSKISPAKTPTSKMRRNAAQKRVQYAESDSDDAVEGESGESDYEESDEESESEAFVVPLKKSPKKAKESLPPVEDVVIDCIKALKDRKGSTLAAIKETIKLNWKDGYTKAYDAKVKKYLEKAESKGDIIRTKQGVGFRGARFTIKGLKIKRKKAKKNKLGKEFDEDNEEYTPQKTGRDEDRERDLEILERQREERRRREAEKQEEKDRRPKKAKKPKQVDWEVEAIKGRKFVQGKNHYLVKFAGWSKPQWEPEENVEGCDDLVEEFLEEEERKKEEEIERLKKQKDSGEYEIKRILDVNILKNGSREFLIRWVGWGPEGDTWEPEEHIDDTELLEKFLVQREKAGFFSPAERRLREAPKKVERLEFASGRSKRQSKRGFRVTYEDMDD